MASLVSRSRVQVMPSASSRPSRSPVVCVKAFATDSNGKHSSIDEINKLIGQRIKEAAAQVGTLRVWQANAAIGKYVKQAAQDAAAGKLKRKVAKR